MSLADIRQSYDKGHLLEDQAKSSPFEQFDLWLNEAITQKLPEPTAMTLATADGRGWPSARIVLLKGADANGFVFYTNYESRKGLEIAAQPRASLLFFWQALEREVRIEGFIEKTTEQESEDYYQSRPLGSRVGAITSAQSKPTTIEALTARAEAVKAQYGDHPPRPKHWGGYRLKPDYFEFWQGRPSRLHDRLTYTPDDQGSWAIGRLAP